MTRLLYECVSARWHSVYVLVCARIHICDSVLSVSFSLCWRHPCFNTFILFPRKLYLTHTQKQKHTHRPVPFDFKKASRRVLNVMFKDNIRENSGRGELLILLALSQSHDLFRLNLWWKDSTPSYNIESLSACFWTALHSGHDSHHNLALSTSSTCSCMWDPHEQTNNNKLEWTSRICPVSLDQMDHSMPLKVCS